MNKNVRLAARIPFAARGFAAAMAGACALMMSASAWAAGTLQSVSHVALPGEQVEITFTLDQPATEPGVFTVDEPARISLDFADTTVGTDSRYSEIDVGPTRGVAIAQGGDRARAVVELTRLVPYTINTEGNQVRLRIGDPAAVGTATTRTAAQPRTAPRTDGPMIEDVDFRRSESGAGRVMIHYTGVTGPVDVSEEGGKIVARFPNAQLPDELAERLDVIDFATPVKFIDVLGGRDETRVVITPLADAEFEQIAYQTGDLFTVELQPLTAAEIEKRQREKPKYTGERISLSFQDVSVRALLQIIADVAEVNMVVSDSVSGTMALRLENVPWDQALAIILTTKGLGKRQEGNVVLVAPLAEIAAREQAELEAQQATVNLAPLRSELIQINYARAADFAALLKSGEISLLSPRGQVTIDQRTNTLLINETREKLEEIRRLINQLDIPVRQVLIESRIVVASREFTRNLGVSHSTADQGAFESPTDGNYLTNSGFQVNLPVANPAGVLTTSILGDTFNLDLALSALETENNGEVISSPRVITANSREASIEQGVEIPYLEAASSGAATVEFKEAVLSLTVTPQITPDERVIMDLFVTQDTQGDAINVQGGGQVPSINTRSLTTQVLVDNGETVVLGGIYEQEDRDNVNRVPVLGELPLIGALFRNTSKQRDKRELLIFVTPKILRQSLTVGR